MLHFSVFRHSIMKKGAGKMSKNKQKKRESSLDVLKKVYGYFLPSAWKKYKLYFFARFGKLLVSVFQPFVAIIYIPKIVEELMGGKDAQQLFRYAAAIVIIEFIFGILNGTFGNIVERYAQKFENYYKMILSRRIMGLDFALTEDKKALDQLELAKNGMSWYSGGLNGLLEELFNLMSSVITLLGVAYIIVTKAPVIVLITAFLFVASFFIQAKLNVIEQQQYAELSKINRIFGYLGWGLVDFRFGKDIRLYHAKDMMIEKWSHFTDEMNDRWEEMANKQLPLQLLNMVVMLLRDFGTYFYVGFLAIMGKISIATTTQMITAAGTFSNTLLSMVTGYQNMVKKANYANEFVKFLDYPMAMHQGTKSVRKGPHVFEFKDLSFTYPGSNVKVLSHVDLKLREGEHLSVVGLNGAGKTTMVKLLCRLYDPTEGEILMDGINIKEYDYEQYMSVFAPVFQDFKLFAFSVMENLLRTDSASEGQKALAQETLKQVGIYDKLQTFPEGTDTVLFKYFDKDGIEPSGGEQQKLAIARALIKDADVVILDEPTAALDPMAEYEIYRQFEEMVKGKTAIYISHRLSSCQFCDRIAVFSEGNVKEYGTHEELVSKENGIYAEMFGAQARYYS